MRSRADRGPSRPMPFPGTDQDAVRRLERWFVRRGLPHFIHNYSASEDVWTRALPALIFFFLLSSLNGLDAELTVGPDGGVSTDGSPAFNILVAVFGLVVILGSWVGLNLHRGRRPFSRPQRVGLVELALWVFVPGIPALVGYLHAAPGEVVQPFSEWLAQGLAEQFVLLGVIYLVTSYGLVRIARWVLGRFVRQGLVMLGLLVRALPLLLLIVAVLFLTTEVWQATGRLVGTGYTVTLCLLAGMAALFLTTTLPREVTALQRFSSWEEVHALAGGTPAEQLARDGEERPPLDAVARAGRRQRLNAALVLLVTQALQVAAVSALLGLFLLVFGVFAVPVETVETWIGQAPHIVGYVRLDDQFFPVTEPLLRVAGFLTAFTSLYFSVASLTDDAYRKEFHDRAAGQVRQAFAVRALYLAAVAPAVAEPGRRFSRLRRAVGR